MTGSATGLRVSRCAATLAALVALGGCSAGSASSTANTASGAPPVHSGTAGMGAGSDAVTSPGAISGGDTATPASAEDTPVNGSNGMLIETETREWLYMRNCGVASDSETPARVVVDVEARSSGPHAWLHGGPFVGIRELDLQAGTLTLRVFDVAAVANGAGEDAVQIDKPAGVPSQSWECEPASGRRGAVVFNETVGIGSGISVGASKRGTRSAIPITGGSIDGRIKGSVLPGGADFQIIDGGYVLDARYTLKTDDGELILVRNCGPASSLVPRFETRVDGPYAWLNEDRWLSSSPGLAAGAVNITIHERD